MTAFQNANVDSRGPASSNPLMMAFAQANGAYLYNFIDFAYIEVPGCEMGCDRFNIPRDAQGDKFLEEIVRRTSSDNCSPKNNYEAEDVKICRIIKVYF